MSLPHLDVQGTFVSQKIRKIRWLPEEYTDTKCFITGSWDDDANSVKVWTFESAQDDKELECPRILSEYKLGGDVTELKLLDASRIAIATSDGDLRLLEVSVYDRETPPRELHLWPKLHNYGLEQCSCTTLDVLEGDIATAGEDGVVKLVSCRRGEVTRTLANADSCSIHSLCYMKHNELVTGNIRGHMKIWDLRANSDKPSNSFILSEDEQAATYIINHPTQPHIVLVGIETGYIAIWDLRMKSCPVSLFNAHEDTVTEMQYHPENPQKLFTCASSGDIWQWNMDTMTKSTIGTDGQTVTRWSGPTDKNDVQIDFLMPKLQNAVNTLHCYKGKVLCGTDTEAVYLIKNVPY